MSTHHHSGHPQQTTPIRYNRNSHTPSDQHCCGCSGCSASQKDAQPCTEEAPPVETRAPEPRLLYRVDEVVHLLNLSRSRVFELLRCGDLRSVTQGRTRLIPRSALFEFIDDLETRHEDAS